MPSAVVPTSLPNPEVCERPTRHGDAVVRIDGAEFLVLLRDAGHAQSLRVATRRREVAAQQSSAPFSLGFAAQHTDEPPEQAIGRADQDLLAVRRAARHPTDRRVRARRHAAPA